MQTKIAYTPNKSVNYKGLQKIVSGGQTGADRGGLEAGVILNIMTGGIAPADYQTENGPDPSLKKFGLTTIDGSYVARTKQNVINSDGTLAIRLHDSNGTDKTIGFSHDKTWHPAATSKDDGFRPVLVIDNLDPEKFEENAKLLQDFITRNRIKVLNVAGHRQTTAGIEKYEEKVTDFLVRALPPVLDQETNSILSKYAKKSVGKK
jgi:hypothetical protein